MQIETVTISTMELQQALRDYCAANGGGIPTTVIIQSYAKQIVIGLEAGGSVAADEFHHSATDAPKC